MKPERVQEIDRLAGTGWETTADGTAITRTYRFPSYRAGVAFAVYLAELAEAADHHPDLLIGYRRVVVTLSTHSAGGVTDKDLAFAARIDGRPLPEPAAE